MGRQRVSNRRRSGVRWIARADVPDTCFGRRLHHSATDRHQCCHHGRCGNPPFAHRCRCWGEHDASDANGSAIANHCLAWCAHSCHAHHARNTDGRAIGDEGPSKSGCSQESPGHLGRQCVVRCDHYGLGRVQPSVRRNSQVSEAPRERPHIPQAHVSKTTMVTRPEPLPHGQRTAYRPLTLSPLPARAPALPGKSRAPWTTVRCSVRSLWAWTGATLGSPKLTGL